MFINSFIFGLKEMNFVAKKTADIIHICTHCGKVATKSIIQRDFYKSYSPYHNKENGVTHLCKECIKLFSLEGLKLNINKLKDVLRFIDKPFIKACLDGAIEEVVKDFQKNNEVINREEAINKYGERVCALYMKNVVMRQYQGLTWINSDADEVFGEVEGIDEIIDDEDLILFWGKGFDIDDYIFLESELSNWKKTHKCDNQAEITLLKEICIKVLEIRKAREQRNSVGNLQKELQDLMRTCSVDPSKANQASAGKSHDAFGLWVKEIEQFRPAEWYEDQEKYKDMDGFIPYIKNYIIRPIENFFTGLRNFVVDDNIDADLDSVEIDNEGDSNGII